MKIGTASVEDMDNKNKNEDDNNDNWVFDWCQPNELLNDKEVDDVVEFTIGDVFGKAFALVNQVIFSL